MVSTNQKSQLIAAALVFIGVLLFVFSVKRGPERIVTVEVRDTVHTETIIKEIDTVYTTKTRFFQKWDFDSIYFVVERDTIVRDSVVRDTLIIRLQDTLSVLPSDSLGKTLFTNAYFGQDTTDHYSLNWAIGIKENELVYFEPVITVNPGTKCTIKQAVKDWWKSLKRK